MAPYLSMLRKHNHMAKQKATGEEIPDESNRNPLHPLHFTSRRSPVYCTNAAVATSQPLATSIGIHVLRGLGGNAADASVAIAAALAVLEPCSTGLGGDMFALWYDGAKKKVDAINGSGKSPTNLTLNAVQNFYEKQSNKKLSSSELQTKYENGVHSITVPGAAQGWEDVFNKYGSGRLTFLQVLEPAIKLADEGFPVGTLTAMRWSQQMSDVTKWYSREEIDARFVEMSVDGKGTPPKPGQLFKNPHMAKVLTSLGTHGAQRGFYQSFPGKSIAECIQKHGGFLTKEDLTNHTTSTFPSPICVNYRGINVWEVPPNGQGIAGLIALKGLQALEDEKIITSSSLGMENGDENIYHPQPSAEMLHAQIEMMRLGFGDARAFVCDPEFDNDSGKIEECSTEWLLDPGRISKRAVDLFDVKKAVIHAKPTPCSCTVSFQVVDETGNAMSFVNSNYMGFGTGLTPSKCGFTLQNRGSGFSLDPKHPNVLEPGKRPYHTIIPCILTHADTGNLYASLSNMGGFMQPQGHMQLVVGLVANGLDAQTAIDAPRFCIIDGTQNGVVLVEDGFHPDTIAALSKFGHNMRVGIAGHEREAFGRAQIITINKETGILCAGSDGRADGCALGY